ncbi:MAG: hypothetical protein AAGA42_15230 [Actinomycetota bacterium]
MGFEIIEQFVEGKRDDRPCEDLIVATNDFVAVIDGASDETGVEFAGKAGGRFAAEAVADAVTRLPRHTDARGFADELTTALRSNVLDVAGTMDARVRWPAASVICCSGSRREVWRVGDCNLLIDGHSFPGHKRVDDAAYGFRAAVNAAALAKGASPAEIVEHDPGARAARPLFDAQQHLANVVGPWGYGCINGRPVPDEYVEVYPVPVGSTVIMTTDGFPTVHRTLAESEDELAGLVERDPPAIAEMWSMGKPAKPGANAPDDRAYIRFTLDERAVTRADEIR